MADKFSDVFLASIAVIKVNAYLSLNETHDFENMNFALSKMVEKKYKFKEDE